jgi:hypothetical protein
MHWPAGSEMDNPFALLRPGRHGMREASRATAIDRHRPWISPESGHWRSLPNCHHFTVYVPIASATAHIFRAVHRGQAARRIDILAGATRAARWAGPPRRGHWFTKHNLTYVHTNCRYAPEALGQADQNEPFRMDHTRCTSGIRRRVDQHGASHGRFVRTFRRARFASRVLTLSRLHPRFSIIAFLHLSDARVKTLLL